MVINTSVAADHDCLGGLANTFFAFLDAQLALKYECDQCLIKKTTTKGTYRQGELDPLILKGLDYSLFIGVVLRILDRLSKIFHFCGKGDKQYTDVRQI